MLEVVLTVCALADPKNCHDERFKVLDGRVTLLQCMMILPPIAEWQSEHPGWRVAGWSCRPYVMEKDV